MAFRGRFIRGVERGFAVVGVTAVLAAGGSYVVFHRVKQKIQKAAGLTQDLPSTFVIEMDLEEVDLVEKASPHPFKALSGNARQELELHKVVEALHTAGADSRVSGLVVTLGSSGSPGGLAQLQELRNAVIRFRDLSQGRAATAAYADSFGEAGTGGTGSYYLASACEKVYMQPTGLLSFVGLHTEVPFLRRLLDKWNVRPLFFAREEYKNAVNMFTEDKFTAPHQEQMTALLGGWFSQIVGDVAQARQLGQREVRTAVDAAPFTADEAVAHKLIDGAKYRDEAMHCIPGEPGMEGQQPQTVERLSLKRYMRAQEIEKRKSAMQNLQDMVQALDKDPGTFDSRTAVNGEQGTKASGKPIVALVTAVGPIITGKGKQRGLQPSDKNIANVPTCAALIKARKDPNVRAVVLRVDSPGGSAVASDAIHREVQRTVAAGKPVVVSMGNVAASGGYFISMPATKIVAQPGTITGSIGVIFGKFNIAGLAKDIGITPGMITIGDNADSFSAFTEFTPGQEQKINSMVDFIYLDFLTKAAEGRGMPLERMRGLAKGRIWTGQDALSVGLVDALGGLQDAIALAKQEAKLPMEEGAVRVKDYPEPKSPLVQLLEAINGTSSTSNTAAVSEALEAGSGSPGLGMVLAMMAAAAAAGGGGDAAMLRWLDQMQQASAGGLQMRSDPGLADIGRQ